MSRLNTVHTARGLSLVETIVVVSIFAILSLAITNAIASFYSFNAYTIAQAYQVAEARRGMQFMVRDIREMTFADNGAYPLIEKSSTTIAFYSDIDRDNSVELVEYDLASTTLHKYVYNAAGSPPTYNTDSPDQSITISRYVQNALQDQSIFTYYNQSGGEATSTTLVTDIRYLGVSLIINIDPVRDPGEFMLRSSAALRNLVTN